MQSEGWVGGESGEEGNKSREDGNRKKGKEVLGESREGPGRQNRERPVAKNVFKVAVV